MPFDRDEVIVESADGREFILLHALCFYRPNRECITVPAGATTDGASTPHLMWRLLPPFGDYWMAALLHDWLYRHGDKPRAEADRIFLEAMTDLGVSWFKRTAIYLGVRIGGRRAYRAGNRPVSLSASK